MWVALSCCRDTGGGKAAVTCITPPCEMEIQQILIAEQYTCLFLTCCWYDPPVLESYGNYSCLAACIHCDNISLYEIVVYNLVCIIVYVYQPACTMTMYMLVRMSSRSLSM